MVKRRWLVLIFVIVIGLPGIAFVGWPLTAKGGSPRTRLETAPQIAGRGVKELTLNVPIYMSQTDPRLAGRGGGSGVGRVPGPIRPGSFTIKPNRFIPVSEDATAVYYQADGAFTTSSSRPGGLRLSKTYPDKIYAYFGDARYPKIQLTWFETLLPGDVRKIRVHYAGQHSSDH